MTASLVIGLIALPVLSGIASTGAAAPPVLVKNQKFEAHKDGATNPQAAQQGKNSTTAAKQVEISPTSATDDNKKQGNAQEEQGEGAGVLETAVDVSNVGLFVLGAVGMYFVWRQLRATEAALAETQKSNEATEASNEIAERSLQVGQRAYIIGSGIDLVPPFAEITIANVGATPATHLSMWSRVRWAENPATIPDTIERGEGERIDSELVIGAGHTLMQTARMPPVTPADTMKMAAGRALVFAYAEINYRDIFGRQRKTTACWTFIPGAPAGREWRLAPKHNCLDKEH